ncbi:unnamed protein product [Parajaminaea phylloscopi]
MSSSSAPSDFLQVPAITPPTPFEIKFDQAELDQFHRKLDDARLPDGPLFPGAKPDAEYDPKAFPTLSLMRATIDYWKRMDLKKFETELNQYPHYTTSVDWCKQLHFLHQPSSRPNAIPLILCHGWPGSFLEFIRVLKPLAEPEDPNAQAFHVVVPSLPGFTFSSGPPVKTHEIGDVDGYCRLLDALMRGLGYDRYASQGGDWGSVHARVLASRFARPDGSGCRACHLNFLPILPGGKVAGGLLMLLPEWVSHKLADYTMSTDEQKAIRKALLYNNHFSTYYKVQRDRPTQIGFGMIDSPVAILGYLAEFTKGLGISVPGDGTHTDQAGTRAQNSDDVTATFMPKEPSSAHGHLDVDWLLQETFLYYLTKSAATSFLPYAVNQPFLVYMLDPTYTIRVPLGYSGFPNEIIDLPLTWARNAAKTNTAKGVTWYALSPTGGHLASTEKPDVFVEHLRTAFAPKGQSSSAGSSGGRSTDGVDENSLGDAGQEGKSFVRGSLWKSGGLWDEERAKDQKQSSSKL